MFAYLIAALALSSSSPIYGVAVAGDGDSLRIGDQRIRLFGIDAPEFDQQCTKAGQRWACGQESADRLSRLVTGREVRCVAMGEDVHGRTLARCSVGQVDVNRTMVATGYAVAFRRYSADYVSAEESAKASRRGIWAGSFQMPSEVRAERGTGRPTKPSAKSRSTRPQYAFGAVSSCNIKGNHSRRGEFIYHLPGMKYYNQTRAEAMFCSEAEARAAGYRRARSQ
ncbi:thermonuclease family protein [Sphingomonas edaphi]|uniref:Thermonuclease family protein n=1 Tax=Sphingomonas edaphi TaxID=2315689 RepID=A0A418PYH4_9SPHN|nr:thermonuclease family protein [Sphingomonas edaphi]RIX27035.1 thermonuclease family protein [Sphingomonas edaphi]